MPVSEVRTQIYLAHEQHEALKQTARKRSVSMAQVIRDAVAAYLREEEAIEERADDSAYLSDPAWRILDAAREIGGSGEPAGAERLEEELYGPITE